MIHKWARGIGLSDADAADLVQEVLLSVLNEIGKFEYDQSKSFRGWLKTITLNRARNLLRKLAHRASPNGNESVSDATTPDHIEFLSAQEYNEMLAQRALEIMQAEFEESTWKACWQSIVDGKPAAHIAETLGITPNAVYLAKSRVLRRLRTELEGLLEEIPDV